MVREGEGHLRVLLDHEHGESLFVQLAQGLEDPLDRQGSQAHGGLVEQQQGGPAHQGPADGQHLLLPAGERLRPSAPALAEEGEQLVDVGDVVWRSRSANPGARRRP